MPPRNGKNVVEPEVAELNRRGEGLGRYTYNAFPPEDYSGVLLVFAAIRLGDHAHIEVESGRQTPQPHSIHPATNTGRAGKLILRWHEWEKLREILDAAECTRIAEVERPTPGMAARYA